MGWLIQTVTLENLQITNETKGEVSQQQDTKKVSANFAKEIAIQAPYQVWAFSVTNQAWPNAPAQKGDAGVRFTVRASIKVRSQPLMRAINAFIEIREQQTQSDRAIRSLSNSIVVTGVGVDSNAWRLP